MSIHLNYSIYWCFNWSWLDIVIFFSKFWSEMIFYIFNWFWLEILIFEASFLFFSSRELIFISKIVVSSLSLINSFLFVCFSNLADPKLILSNLWRINALIVLCYLFVKLVLFGRSYFNLRFVSFLKVILTINPLQSFLYDSYLLPYHL